MKFIMIKTMRIQIIQRIMIIKRKKLVKIKVKIKINQSLKKGNLLFHKKMRIKLKTKS